MKLEGNGKSQQGTKSGPSWDQVGKIDRGYFSLPAFQVPSTAQRATLNREPGTCLSLSSSAAYQLNSSQGAQRLFDQINDSKQQEGFVGRTVVRNGRIPVPAPVGPQAGEDILVFIKHRIGFFRFLRLPAVDPVLLCVHAKN